MERARATDHIVQKTTVEIDMTELDAAREILGTSTIRDTVNTALREVTRRVALARTAMLIEQGAFDVVDPEELTELRRSRIGI
jgi:Arc/MetJ family transcription regulator